MEGIGLIPIFDQIIIEQLPDENRAGLYVPDQDRIGPRYATVLAVGPGRPSDYTGTVIPMPAGVVAGATILFHGGAGTQVRVDGKDVKFIFPRDVMATKP